MARGTACGLGRCPLAGLLRLAARSRRCATSRQTLPEERPCAAKEAGCCPCTGAPGVSPSHPSGHPGGTGKGGEDRWQHQECKAVAVAATLAAGYVAPGPLRSAMRPGGQPSARKSTMTRTVLPVRCGRWLFDVNAAAQLLERSPRPAVSLPVAPW